MNCPSCGAPDDQGCYANCSEVSSFSVDEYTSEIKSGKSVGRVVPVQKPGRSKQDYGTPIELLNAVRSRLQIRQFWIDLAASEENSVCEHYYSEADDAFKQSWVFVGEWGWLNPPFGHIDPWVEKAAHESMNGANIVMLVPSSVGSNWWSKWVIPYAYVTHLNGRITFVGETTYYPKDCSLLLFTPWGFTGTNTWRWRP